LFFCVCVDANDNELAYLEAIHFFVEVLDQFFGNVCELDLVFNFYKVSVVVAWLHGPFTFSPGMRVLICHVK
jgi:AP-2 complex subunit sigma-1